MMILRGKSEKRADVNYYDWDGDICRSSGDIFNGYAERFVEGKGWTRCHFFNLQNSGFIITAQEAEYRLNQLNTPNIIATPFFRKV